MALKFGILKAQDVTYNGNSVSKIICNGTTVYESPLVFTLLTDNTYSVSANASLSADINRIMIPSTWMGRAVTTIAANAFRNCTSLVTIDIPASVKSIGNYAFSGCTSLTAVTGCLGLQTMGYYAFNGCSSLVYFAWTPSLYSLDSGAFYDCVNIDITTGLANTSITIFDYAFGASTTSFSNRTNVALPQSVTRIRDGAFPGVSYFGFPYPSSWDRSSYDETDGEYYELGSVSITSANATQNATDQSILWSRTDNGTTKTAYVALNTIDTLHIGITLPRIYKSNTTATVTVSYSTAGAPTTFMQLGSVTRTLVPEAVSVLQYPNSPSYYMIRVTVTPSGGSSKTVTELNTRYKKNGDVKSLVPYKVTWAATAFDDTLNGYYPDVDHFVAGGYLTNNEGTVTPVLYKTITAIPEPDLNDQFYYVGQENVCGSICDKWRKIEVGDTPYFYWDTSEKRFVYTNIIVSDGAFIGGILY